MGRIMNEEEFKESLKNVRQAEGPDKEEKPEPAPKKKTRTEARKQKEKDHAKESAGGSGTKS